MRTLIVIFLMVFTTKSYSNSIDILDLRKHFYAASINKSSADSFLLLMESVNINTDPVLLGYRGMAYMMQANYSKNPFVKLRNFNAGKTIIEQAIQKNPWNIEIRFLRFCVQTNVPLILGYSGDINNDKLFITLQWKRLNDLDLKNRISKYMIDSKQCNELEKLNFK
ncbi:MAG: hypothetical protein WCO28_04180 [Bacteroidota bacterium]